MVVVVDDDAVVDDVLAVGGAGDRFGWGRPR